MIAAAVADSDTLDRTHRRNYYCIDCIFYRIRAGELGCEYKLNRRYVK